MVRSKPTVQELRTISILAVMLCTINAPVTAADDARRQRPSLIDEVVVTAQRREEAISDVPIAIQAFTGDTLRQLGIVDTRDLASLVPGFSFSHSGRDIPIYTLRGIGFDDPSRTANSAVGVYVDEVPIPYPYMTQGANVDVERIEVLKGPQGTLYGRNTTGGAINYIAAKPTDSLEFGVEAEYGRFESYSVESYLSGPLTERLRGRLAYRHIGSGEGWQKSLTRRGDRLGEKDKQAGRATLEWDPADALRLSLSLDWWRDRSEPLAPQPTEIVPQNDNFNKDQMHPDVRNHPVVTSDNIRRADWMPNIPWTLNNEFLMPALRTYWDVGDKLSFAFIAAYTDFKTDKAKYPLSGLSVPNNETVPHSTDATARSFELRADGQLFNGQLSWLAGLYTSKDDVHDFQTAIFDTQSGLFNHVVPGVIPLAAENDREGRQRAESDAMFANVDYAPIDHLRLSLGARYTEETRKFAGCARESRNHRGETGLAPAINARSISEGGSGGAGPGDCLTLDEETRNPSLIRKELSEDNLGGKVSISWTPIDSHLLYASYSRGFKSGSFPVAGASEGAQFDPVTQEQLDAIELGGKTSWFDEKLRINFAVFDYDYQDKQLFSFFIDPVFGPLPKLFNVPKSQVRGAELEIQSSPLPGLFVSVAASYLDTKIIEFVGINSEGEEVDFAGNKLPLAPDKEVTVLANYSFQLPFISNLEGTVGVNYSYVGDSTTNIDNAPHSRTPSYQLVNARLGVGDLDGTWDIGIWVRNATNEFYLLNTPRFSSDTRVRFTGMPRTFGVTFSYRYF